VFEEPPDERRVGRVGVGEVDVTAPDECRLGEPVRERLDHPERLGVVEHDHVVRLGDVRRVLRRPPPVGLAHPVGEGSVLALEAVVYRLRHLVERIVPFDDLPAGLDADVVHQRNERRQHLRYASARGRGVEVQDARVGQIGGDRPDTFAAFVREVSLVVAECPVPHRGV
jgi:hypothetical protein